VQKASGGGSPLAKAPLELDADWSRLALCMSLLSNLQSQKKCNQNTPPAGSTLIQPPSAAIKSH
jgi:hypothetical protein